MSPHETIVQYIKIGFACAAFSFFMVWSVRVIQWLEAIERNGECTVEKVIKQSWDQVEFPLSEPPRYDTATKKIK